MADANRQLAPIARDRSRILDDLGVERGRYLVATVHREANVRPERLTRITDGLSRLPESVVFPAHPGRAPPSQVTLCRLLPTFA